MPLHPGEGDPTIKDLNRQQTGTVSPNKQTANMYKLLATLSLLFAAASAGIIGAPYAHGGLAYGHAAPVVHAAPIAVAAPVVHAPVAVAHAPVATSYANTYRVVHDSVPVVKTVAHAPVVHAAPLAIHSAPLAVASPIAYGHGYHH